jgi:Arc/MetJ-type ribon-helix-helix transcriptional regulator
MQAIPAKLTPKLIQEMDDIIHDGWYASRSELIRDAIRETVKKMKTERLEAAIKEDVKWGLYGKRRE